MASTQVLLLRLLYRKQERLRVPENQTLDCSNSRFPEHISYTCSSPSSLRNVGLKVTASEVGTVQGCLGNSRRLIDLQEVEALKGPQEK